MGGAIGPTALSCSPFSSRLFGPPSALLCSSIHPAGARSARHGGQTATPHTRAPVHPTAPPRSLDLPRPRPRPQTQPRFPPRTPCLGPRPTVHSPLWRRLIAPAGELLTAWLVRQPRRAPLNHVRQARRESAGMVAAGQTGARPVSDHLGASLILHNRL